MPEQLFIINFISVPLILWVLAQLIYLLNFQFVCSVSCGMSVVDVLDQHFVSIAVFIKSSNSSV